MPPDADADIDETTGAIHRRLSYQLRNLVLDQIISAPVSMRFGEQSPRLGVQPEISSAKLMVARTAYVPSLRTAGSVGTVKVRIDDPGTERRSYTIATASANASVSSSRIVSPSFSYYAIRTSSSPSSSSLIPPPARRSHPCRSRTTSYDPRYCLNLALSRSSGPEGSSSSVPMSKSR